MKKSLLFFSLCVFILIPTVNAEIIYTNDFNVSLAKEEYTLISKLYYDGYQKYLTQDDYKLIFSKDALDKNIESFEYYESSSEGNIMLLDTIHTTASKKITIRKLCSETCLITVVASWLESPKVRSYDLIGAYLSNVSLVAGPLTKLVSESNNYSSSEIVSTSSGFGVSIKLPSGDSSISLTQTFEVTSGGEVYASYQHAIKSISLANSKKYTVDYSGYGNVFLFNTYTIKAYYDGMGGVSISV